MSTKQKHKATSTELAPPLWVEAILRDAKKHHEDELKEYYGSAHVFEPDLNWFSVWSHTAETRWATYQALKKAGNEIGPMLDTNLQAMKKLEKKYEKEKADLSDSCPVCRLLGKRTMLCSHAIRTQKARGLTRLRLVTSHGSGSDVLQIYGILHQKEVLGELRLPAFARPCPHRPRHGYIDSRVIQTKEELDQLAAEVFKDDPQGEVMLTPVYPNVKYNAIWTPGLLTIGKGHDGATNGKDTISVPLSGRIPEHIEALLEGSSVGKDEDPYIEAITVGGTTKLTQLRAGPKGARLGNYVPAEIKVKEVIQTNGEDLLQWEAKIHALEGRTGVVVYHPGGSPADHYSVHCRCFSIPVMYDRKPEIGEVLDPTDVPQLDPNEVIAGAVIAAQLMTKDPESLDRAGWAELMLFGFHMSAAMSGKASRLLGASVVSMIRLGMAALAGEARHCQSINGLNLPSNRAEVWKGMDGKSLTELRATVNELINVHLCGQFASAGFGGKKWAQCGVSLVPLFNGLEELAKAQTEAESVAAINSTVRALNVAVNQAHNGGWWMNKFVYQGAFDRLQINDPFWVCKEGLLARIVEIMTAEEPNIKRAVGIWQRWPPLQYNPPEVKSVGMTYDAMWDTLTVYTKFSLYSGGKASFTFPVPEHLRKEILEQDLEAVVDGDKITIKTSKGSVIAAEPVLSPQDTPAYEEDDDDDDDDDLDLGDDPDE